MQSLELRLLRPEYVTARCRGSQLRARAVITNHSAGPVQIRRAHLVGSETRKRVRWARTVPASIEAGASVECPITRAWPTARRLRHDPALILEIQVEGDGGQKVRSPPVDLEDSRTWTPEDEITSTFVVVVVGVFWWFLYVPFLQLPRAPQIVLCALLASACAATCSVFYAALWRGETMRGIGLAIGPQRRVRPLTEVVLTCVSVWFVLTAPFAFATYVIDGHQLGDGTPMDRYFEAIGLYAWHAVDVLPFVQATNTLRWPEPVPGYSHATGGLLLVYKLLVLAPVVAAARAAWRGRTVQEPHAPARAPVTAQQQPAQPGGIPGPQPGNSVGADSGATGGG